MPQVTGRMARYHLVSGTYDLSKMEPEEGKLELVSDRILVTTSAKEGPSLNVTDERGVIMSSDSKGKQLHPLQTPLGAPLRLAIAPRGTGMTSFAAFAGQWQNELFSHIKASGLPIDLTTIPVKFGRRHLRPPENENEERVYKLFGSGDFYGHLLPRQRCLVILFETRVLKNPPGQLRAKLGSNVLGMQRVKGTVEVALPDKGKADYVAYMAIGNHLQPGPCQIAMPSEHLHHVHHHHERHEVKRSFKLAFDMQGLFGEIETQVFEMPSVEASILLHFPARYPHLLPKAEDQESPAYAAGVTAISSARSSLFLANTQRKMVAGLMPSLEEEEPPQASPKSSAESKEKKPASPLAGLSGKIFEAFEEHIAGAVEQLDSTSPQARAAPVVLSAYKGWRKYKDAKEKWDVLNKEMLKTATAVLGDKKPKDLLHPSVLKSVFHPSNYRQSLLRQVEAYSGSGEPLPVRLGLIKIEGLDKSLQERFEREAVAKRFWTFEKKAVNAVSTSLTVLEVAISVDRLVADISALMDAYGDKSFQAARLRKLADAYADAYGQSPCVAAFPRLEALRLLEDAARAGVDSAESAVVDKVVDLTLDVMAVVPIAREVACLLRIGMAAKELGMLTLDLMSDAIDRFWIRHRSAGDRLFELSRQHALNVRALPKWQEAGEKAPHVEWRSRVIALIGLLRLIERMGSPHDRPDRFQEKLERYKVKEYIETYLLAPRPFTAFVLPSLPLDEVWLYARGNEESSWNESLAALRSTDSSADVTIGEEGGYRTARFGAYPAFPIERLETASLGSLARTFALDFSSIADKRLAWTRVYVKDRTTQKWVPVEQARFRIGPRDPVRVVAIFRAKSAKEDLRGVPVSLQLIRADAILDRAGPVYRTSLAKTAAWCSSDGEDKDLLRDDPTEQKYAEDPMAYVAVFHPFYLHRKALHRGLKPVGHIGLSADPSYEIVLNLKAGDDAVRIQHGGEDVRVKVHIDLRDGTEVGMLLNREFLDRKTTDRPLPNLFNFPYQKIVPLGVLALVGKTVAECLKTGDLFELGKGREIAWGQPLTLVCLFGARFTATREWPSDDVRFPGFLRFREPRLGRDEYGPDYPAEVVCRLPGEPQTAWRWASIIRDLATRQLIDPGGLTSLSPSAGGACSEPMVLFACCVTLQYSLEARDQRSMNVIPGPKPFTSSRKAEHQEYVVGLHVPSQLGLGDELESFLRIYLKGLQTSPTPDSSFGASADFVTDERYFKSLELEKV